MRQIHTSILGLLAAILASPPLAAQQPRFNNLHQMVPAMALPHGNFAVGDIDGDGDLDVLAVIGLHAQVRMLCNDGTGIFRDAGTVASLAASDWITDLALDDLDGDGDPDLVVGGQDESRLFRNSMGVFTDITATHLPPGSDRAISIALGDVNGDGDLDIFLGRTGNWSGGHPLQNHLYLNDGSGGFTDVTRNHLPAVPECTKRIELGDVDGDGDLDAVIQETQVQLLQNDGSGVFRDVTAARLPAGTEGAPHLADLDGDGDLDAWIDVWNRSRGRAIDLLRNDGSGSFAIAAAGNIPSGIGGEPVFADVDADGDVDALVVSWENQWLLRNDGTGAFTDVSSANLPADTGYTSIVVLLDVDRDGDADALVGKSIYCDMSPGPWACPSLNQMRLYLNDGTGVFTDVTMPAMPYGEGRRGLVLGDVDGDGDADLLYQVDREKLLLNRGNGMFIGAPAGSLPLPASGSWGGASVALGDLDGDRDLDLLVEAYPEDRLYLNDGTGVFADVTATHLPGAVAGPAYLGDLDGDGDLDALVAGTPFALLRNDGRGAFTLSDVGQMSAGWGVHIALGDVDGDRDLDALLGNHLYLNDGAGAFTDVTASHFPSSGFCVGECALADVDGDGDLDATLYYAYCGRGGCSGHQQGLYLNDGTGVFTDVTATHMPQGSGGALLEMFDADGDGDLDALLASPPSMYPSGHWLLENDGNGVFTESTATFFPDLWDGIEDLAVGDLDGDGDADAIFANYGQDRIYTNLSRQLAWRGVPRVGKPLEIELWGPVQGAFQLAYSLTGASIPLPPLGTLWLDPRVMSPAMAGALDGQGRASVAIQVPGDSALVGTSLHWQALVAFPLGLTNLEITTLTGL